MPLASFNMTSLRDCLNEIAVNMKRKDMKRKDKGKGKAAVQDVDEEAAHRTREDEEFEAELRRIEEEDQMLAAMKESRLHLHYAGKRGESSTAPHRESYTSDVEMDDAREESSGLTEQSSTPDVETSDVEMDDAREKSSTPEAETSDAYASKEPSEASEREPTTPEPLIVERSPEPQRPLKRKMASRKDSEPTTPEPTIVDQIPEQPRPPKRKKSFMAGFADIVKRKRR
ncbi:hypothetical protein UCDDS831_g06591 [Diplodia seriata]|uniref:Uncharacterized protein n=1 Tax=Diplodia seriata TaxID=420778 RepID=A0A0G2E456_9PEZI|nr:hypothetical protein UCDDS831_g06591 [Diplodia seriata]